MSSTSVAPGPVFHHLQRLTHGPGLFEHADYTNPRPEHGYCLDDVARALVVVCREPEPTVVVQRLGRTYLDFTLRAIAPDGNCHNRMSTDGTWVDDPAPGDWWGRAVWGLGVAAVQGPTPQFRQEALDGFRRAASASVSPFLRASAFAALGAGPVACAHPDERVARDLLRDAVRAIGVPSEAVVDSSWPWPERRLTYANASIAEALLVAGSMLPDQAALRYGLQLLDFLLRTETRDGHLSVTPVGGRDRSSEHHGFDQQPIEVASLADACARAFDLTGEDRWRQGVELAAAWFLGDNDAGTAMIDPLTGAGFDGLEREGRNLNQGAESTLAALSTTQQARRLGVWS